MTNKIISLILSICFIFQQTGLVQAAAVELNLSNYFARMASGMSVDSFRPVHLRYFSYDSLNNSFKVLIDKGDFQKGLSPKALKGLSPKGTDPEARLKAETKELLKYFLIGVTLPNDKFWVNLRPDSPKQIIDFNLEETDIGKIMLEADLQLKKDTAAFTSPQTPEGKEYWERLYKKASELYGTENVTIPTLTRPWIVPNEIIVRETADSAYVYKATMKVCLEQDYLKTTPGAINSAIDYTFKDSRSKALNEYSTQLIRELVIPKLTKEVNLSKRYAPLRQVYYSLILSRWFKLRFQGQSGTYPSLIDKNDLTNLTSKNTWDKSTYFNEYKKSFAQGEYNIKEPVYTPSGQVIRSYFSGGIGWGSSSALTPKNVFAGTIPLRGAFSNMFISASGSGDSVDNVLDIENPAGAASPAGASSALQKLTPLEEKEFELYIKKGIIIPLGNVVDTSGELMYKVDAYWHPYETPEETKRIKALMQEIDREVEEDMKAKGLPYRYVPNDELVFLAIEALLLARDIAAKYLTIDEIISFSMLYEYIWAIAQERRETIKLDDGAKLNLKSSEQISRELADILIANMEANYQALTSIKDNKGKHSHPKFIQELIERVRKGLDPRFLNRFDEAELKGIVKKVIELMENQRASSAVNQYDPVQAYQDQIDYCEPGVRNYIEGLSPENKLKLRELFIKERKERLDNFYLSGKRATKMDIIIAGRKALVIALNKLCGERLFDVEYSVSKGHEIVMISSTSSPLDGTDTSLRSVSIPEHGVGGIDFKHKALAGATTYEAMGSFSGLDFSLPKLSSQALLSFNLDKEQSDISRAIDNGIIVSGQRIKEFMAASVAKGELENRRDTVITWLAKLGILEETQCCTQESSKEYREALVIADSAVI